MKVGDLIYFGHRSGMWVILKIGKTRIKIWHTRDNSIGKVTKAHAIETFRPVGEINEDR